MKRNWSRAHRRVMKVQKSEKNQHIGCLVVYVHGSKRKKREEASRVCEDRVVWRSQGKVLWSLFLCRQFCIKHTVFFGLLSRVRSGRQPYGLKNWSEESVVMKRERERVGQREGSVGGDQNSGAGCEIEDVQKEREREIVLSNCVCNCRCVLWS